MYCTLCSQKGGFVCTALLSTLRNRYNYPAKTMGPIVKKAMGFCRFGDRYLNGFLGVASLIVICVSFIEYRCRKCISVRLVNVQMADVLYPSTQAPKQAK